jgi:Raf kinase inhibitor-like YbhB/YbcL family protein
MARRLVLCCAALVAAGCAGGSGDGQASAPGGTSVTLQASSPAFNEGDTIPAKFTADGANKSPELRWSGAPENTKSFAVICEDPDAPRGTWTHWVLFNLPADKTGLAEGVATEKELPDGTRQGKNDFGKIGYSGPDPPKGKPHRYYYKVFALDTKLDLPAGATRDQLLKAMKGHAVAEGQVMGKFGRP